LLAIHALLTVLLIEARTAVLAGCSEKVSRIRSQAETVITQMVNDFDACVDPHLVPPLILGMFDEMLKTGKTGSISGLANESSFADIL
jgi:hypothetical protein